MLINRCICIIYVRAEVYNQRKYIFTRENIFSLHLLIKLYASPNCHLKRLSIIVFSMKLTIEQVRIIYLCPLLWKLQPRCALSLCIEISMIHLNIFNRSCLLFDSLFHSAGIKWLVNAAANLSLHCTAYKNGHVAISTHFLTRCKSK